MNNLYDELAEQNIIGGLLFNDKTDIAADVLSILKPADFANQHHKFVWEVILKLVTQGQEINAVTVPSALQDLGSDLSSYVMRLGIDAVSQANLVNTANRLKKISRLRAAMEAINDAAAEINKHGDPEDRLKNALAKVASIGDDEGDQDIKDPVSVMTEVFNQMERALKSKNGLLGISSGFENVDKFTNGFQSQDLIIVAAPPSCGKTTLTLNFAEYAAFLSPEPKKVLFFSLEMSAEQLLQKTIANIGNIFLSKVRNGQALDDHENRGFERIATAQEIIQSRNDYFRIDDKGGQTVAEMQARAKRTAMRLGGLDLIVVDYLHKIEADGESEVMQVRAKVRGMKNMAKKLKCPVIVLSQLNRSLVGRPEMKNLLGSSAIEQEADVIMFLYDEDYEGNRGPHSLTEVIFAKNRMGETGATFLQPELSFSRFTNTQRLPAAKPVEEKKYKKREFN
jgi:replicative DNA helicase